MLFTRNILTPPKDGIILHLTFSKVLKQGSKNTSNVSYSTRTARLFLLVGFPFPTEPEFAA
jgi:hypothetical protein